ncbi:hypothetical protein KKC94_02660 [Patescibacteria group bacterium]|nr:hypothetical protein [Patescibacteria group bacterium]
MNLEKMENFEPENEDLPEGFDEVNRLIEKASEVDPEAAKELFADLRDESEAHVKEQAGIKEEALRKEMLINQKFALWHQMSAEENLNN